MAKDQETWKDSTHSDKSASICIIVAQIVTTYFNGGSKYDGLPSMLILLHSFVFYFIGKWQTNMAAL